MTPRASAESAVADTGTPPAGEIPTPPDDGKAAHPLRRNRDFRRLWIGQATSELGSSIAGLALPLLVLATTGSAALTGLAGTLVFATSWLLQLPAGYAADRWNRRRIMLWSEGIRGAAQLILVAAILTHDVRTWLILTLVLVSTAVGEFFGPAQLRTMRAIIRTDQIVDATAINQARSYAADLVGPLLGGALFALGRAIPFLVDTASFAVSAGSIARVGPRSDPAAPGRAPGAALAEVRAGWRFVWHNRLLRSSMAYSTGSNFVATALIFAVILIAGRRSGGGTAVGAAIAIASVGGIAGAAIAPWVQRRLPVRTILLLTGIPRILLIAAFAFTSQPVLLGLYLAAFVLLAPTASTALAATRTRVTPPEILGRSSSCISFVASALQPFAPLAVGLMLAHLHDTTTMLVLSGLMAMVAFYVWRTNGFDDSGTDRQEHSRPPRGGMRKAGGQGVVPWVGSQERRSRTSLPLALRDSRRANASLTWDRGKSESMTTSIRRSASARRASVRPWWRTSSESNRPA